MPPCYPCSHAPLLAQQGRGRFSCCFLLPSHVAPAEPEQALPVVMKGAPQRVTCPPTPAHQSRPTPGACAHTSNSRAAETGRQSDGSWQGQGLVSVLHRRDSSSSASAGRKHDPLMAKGFSSNEAGEVVLVVPTGSGTGQISELREGTRERPLVPAAGGTCEDRRRPFPSSLHLGFVSRPAGRGCTGRASASFRVRHFTSPSLPRQPCVWTCRTVPGGSEWRRAALREHT